ncbi:Fungal-trans domain-containing protein [Mycena venus]|uniref:Fungal-trans domain-containing protein n=1 Tax=Mycena venus TaxID=2733690 RepID=A0A8H7CF45_9AGAR|nr:Fungal-trans domain-containing protein [Mycena venus]
MANEGPTSVSFDIPSQKAKSCTNCRRRKIKCDAERPKCGQCARSMGFQDCEYADDGGLTGTQILQEQISLLEARIEELEKPKELRSMLILQNPYAGERRATSPSSALPRGLICTSAVSSTLLSPREPICHPNSANVRVELEPLVQTFLYHSSQFGFFLNMHNFQEAAMGRSGLRPTAVLLDIVNLWAIHLAPNESTARTYEASYLSKALHTSIDALSGTHNHTTILHSIQAEVLLSIYFLRNTRFLEGKYHLSAAVSLVISSGLHRTRSADLGAAGGPLGPAFRRLPPPRDVMEEYERINAFWTVLAMNNCWTTADGSPSNISYTVPDARIDTLADHEQLPESSIGTVTNFLANLPDTSNGASVAAFHAKAAILFEQASRLAAQYHPSTLAQSTIPDSSLIACIDLPPDQSTQFYVSFNAIDTLIEGFKIVIFLPTAHLHDARREHERKMLVIHSLVHVATIQLHNPFVGVDNDNEAPSRLRVLDAARAIVDNLTRLALNEFVYVDPIMGTLLMATCQVFIAELGRFRRNRAMDSPVPPEERALTSAIETVLAAMSIFAPTCQLMGA